MGLFTWIKWTSMKQFDISLICIIKVHLLWAKANFFFDLCHCLIELFIDNSVTKIFVIKRARTCHLLYKRLGCYRSARKTDVRVRIFKLSPIHASAIYQIPWIYSKTEFNESSAPFRKKSNVSNKLDSLWAHLEALSLSLSLICKWNFIRGVLVSVNFGCFSPSRFSHFHCNAMRKVITAPKKLHTNQQNEHTPDKPQLLTDRFTWGVADPYLSLCKHWGRRTLATKNDPDGTCGDRMSLAYLLSICWVVHLVLCPSIFIASVRPWEVYHSIATNIKAPGVKLRPIYVLLNRRNGKGFVTERIFWLQAFSLTADGELIHTRYHTVDTEFSVTNFFCLHFSEHAQWGLPVMSDILGQNICGYFLQYMWIILTLMHKLGVPI